MFWHRWLSTCSEDDRDVFRDHTRRSVLILEAKHSAEHKATHKNHAGGQVRAAKELDDYTKYLWFIDSKARARSRIAESTPRRRWRCSLIISLSFSPFCFPIQIFSSFQTSSEPVRQWCWVMTARFIQVATLVSARFTSGRRTESDTERKKLREKQSTSWRGQRYRPNAILKIFMSRRITSWLLPLKEDRARTGNTQRAKTNRNEFF